MKQLGCEADYSPPFSVKVKNVHGIIPPLAQCFHCMMLI